MRPGPLLLPNVYSESDEDMALLQMVVGRENYFILMAFIICCTTCTCQPLISTNVSGINKLFQGTTLTATRINLTQVLTTNSSTVSETGLSQNPNSTGVDDLDMLLTYTS
jgi:hypothetical protein